MNLPAHIVAFLRGRNALASGSSYLVACSGGRDSVALALLMHEVASSWDVRVELATIDHGLRPEAREETAFVRRLAERLGIAVHVRRVDASAGSGSVQDRARALRYAALEDVRRERGLEWVLTAHHAGDQAETVLWRFLAGAGVDGLGGIPAVNGSVLRPLLSVMPAVLTAWLRERGEHWMEDASNDTDAYLRNAIRRHVLPVIREYVQPSPEQVLGRSARMFSALAEYLEDLTAEAARAVIRVQGDAVSLAVQPLKGYLEFQQLLLARKALRAAGLGDPGSDATYAVLGLLDADTGKRAVPGDGFIAFRDRDHVRIMPHGELQGPVPVRLGETVRFGPWIFSSKPADAGTAYSADPTQELVDLTSAGTSWMLRTWKAGDRLRPLGMNGSKLVSDVLTDARVPAHLRAGIPVLERGGEILWVCGVRLADGCRVTAATTERAILTFHIATDA